MDKDGSKKLSRSRRKELDEKHVYSQQDIATFEKCVLKHETCWNKRSISCYNHMPQDRFKEKPSERKQDAKLSGLTIEDPGKELLITDDGSTELQTPGNQQAYDEYNGNPPQDQLYTPESLSENDIFSSSDLQGPTLGDEAVETTLSSILDNEFDEPVKEPLTDSKYYSSREPNNWQKADTHSTFDERIFHTPCNSTPKLVPSTPTIFTPGPIEPQDEISNTYDCDNLPRNKGIFPDHIILSIPSSALRINELEKKLEEKKLEEKKLVPPLLPQKQVKDTIITIPPSCLQIPNIQLLGPLARRQVQSVMTEIPRIYDPIQMKVIDNASAKMKVPVGEALKPETPVNQAPPTNNNLPDKSIPDENSTEKSPQENEILTGIENEEKLASVVAVSTSASSVATTTREDMGVSTSDIPSISSIKGNMSEKETSIDETNISDSPSNEYSLISADGNILNSPASRHLISKLGKFVAQELISKRRIRVERGKQKSSEAVNKVENQNVKVKFADDKPQESGSEKLLKVSKNEEENKNDVEDAEIPKILKGETVPCRYANSGCPEKLEKGSIREHDHYLTCKYRPIKCLLAPACNEILCHHNYIPHLMQHFMVPTYSKELVSTVVLTPEDFSRAQTWTPKWFSAYDNHFFAAICRKDNGTWASWVWMLGDNDDAQNFAARTTLYKGQREVSQVLPVHSIRTEQEEIEAERTCLLVTDETMLELSQVGENMFSDFSMKVVLIPNAKELNKTIRENRAILSPRSRIQHRSDKLCITYSDTLE